MTDLRPYQYEARASVKQLYLAGRRRLLVVLPTGCGKTVIFASFPRFFGLKRRMLVLAHREELLDQAADKIRLAAPDFTVGIEQAGRRAEEAQVVVASVPTLRGTRLAALDPGQFRLVVCDEAHHAVAKSYRAVFDHLGLFAPDTRKLLVGFTATPGRGDRVALGHVFEQVAYSRELPEMIREGWLCRVRGKRTETEAVLDGVQVSRGDFADGALAAAVNTPERNRAVVRAFLEHAPARKGLAFCVDVQHAKDLAEAFVAAGVPARPVWGDMPDEERASALADLRSGASRVTTNCMVLTEGFDEPTIDCVLLARPTKQLPLTAQMVGRGTRLSSGKEDLLVLDFADICSRHDLADLAALFKLPRALDLDGEDALAALKEIEEIEDLWSGIDLGGIRSLREIELRLRDFDLVSVMDGARRQTGSALAWMPQGRDQYVLRVLGGGWLRARQDETGRWRLLHRAVRTEPPAFVGDFDTARDAIRAGDALVLERHADVRHAMKTTAAWRRAPASDKQLHVLNERGIPHPANVTKGQASLLLDRFLGREL